MLGFSRRSEAKLRYNSPVSSSDGHQPLADQLVVFTGKLRLLGRRQARDLVARLGGATANEVTTQTTMLVVGAAGFGPEPHSTANDDPRQTSHKLRPAEALDAHQLPLMRINSAEAFCPL